MVFRVVCSIIFAIMLLPVVFAAQIPDLQQAFVNDLADVYTPQQEQNLTAFLTFVEQNTTAEFAVVTVPSLDNQAIETYSLAVAEQLGIGKEDTDNGLLLLIAVQDRQYRFEVGYGLEGALPDGLVGNIGTQVLQPAFQQELYYQGTAQAMYAAYGYAADDPSIISEFQSTYGQQNQLDDRTRILISIGVFLIILFVILGGSGQQNSGLLFFPMFMGGHHRSGFGGSGGFGSGGFGGFGGGGFGGGGSSGGW